MTEKHAEFCEGLSKDFLLPHCACGAMRKQQYITRNEYDALVAVLTVAGPDKWGEISRVKGMMVSNRSLANIRRKNFVILSVDKQKMMLTTEGKTAVWKYRD